MDIRLVVTDLDGTLLRDDKSISDYTRSVVQQVRARGTKVACATARGRVEVVVPNDMLDAQISGNGAITSIDGKIIHQVLVPYRAARPLLMACHERGMLIVASIGGKWYAMAEELDDRDFGVKHEIVDFSVFNIDTEKVWVWIDSPEDLDFMRSHLSDELYLQVSRDGLAMVMHRGATKSNAALALAQHWGITPSQIVAFGDDLNDIDMLKACGTGVVMGNAIDKVKAISAIHADTNENNGVAKWLDVNILNI